MMKKYFILSILLAATLLSACAGTQFKWSDARKINVGMTSEEVVQIMGQPNGIYSQEGKLIYSWYSANLINGNRALKIEFKDNKVTEAPAVPNSFKD
jgi:spermidine/putrescine-binding protein